MRFDPSLATSSRPARKGIVLLVVIGLLTLFAAVGLSFVYYAESEASASRLAAESADLGRIDLDPEMTLSYFLSQFIFDTNNEYSALRGTSLARSIYDFDPSQPTYIAFNGAGILRYPVTPPIWGGLSKNNILLTNFTNFSSNPNDAAFVRDPGYFSYRADAANYQYTGGFNVPWTYPDLHSPYLASINASGEVLAPSYFRPWVWDESVEGKIEFSGKPYAKYMTPRPHATYHPQFDPPDPSPTGPDAGGPNVKNFDQGPGLKKPDGTFYNNDSYWIDLGFPVMTAKNGKKFKVLFAPLIIDLDSKVNLCVHGNIKGTDGAGNPISNSQHGIGYWEVNPQKVLKYDPTEYQRLFKGSISKIGRYGPNDVPASTMTTYPYGVQTYAKYNFDATNPATLTYVLPPGVIAFPTYPLDWTSRDAAEVANHPGGYNPYANVGDDLVPLSASNLEPMYRGPGATGSYNLANDLFRILPNNMANFKARMLSTVLSKDLDRPGLIPFFPRDPNKAPAGSTSYLNFDAAARYAKFAPLPGPPVDPTFPVPPVGATPFENEFDVQGATKYWRSALSYAKRIMLNRSLTSYPAPVAGTGLLDTTSAAYMSATNDRVNMAIDIYNWLVKLSGAKDPRGGAGATMTPGTPDYQAAKWLAQVSVNIVDFIDEDDYMTAWQWNSTNQPGDYVFGTELPKLVINEVYAQLDNDSTENAAMIATKYYANFWVELHNPSAVPVSLKNTLTPQLEYRLQIIDTPNFDPATGQPKTVPPPPIAPSILADLNAADPSAVDIAAGSADSPYSCVAGTEVKGFYVFGPDNAANGGFIMGRDPMITATSKRPELSWTILDVTQTPAMRAATKYVVMLQRLANPKLPKQETSTLANYNPYITVDYYNDVRLNNGALFDNAGPVAVLPPAPTTWSSQGRAQPFTAQLSRWADQNPETPPAGQPKHTFFRHNGRADTYANFTTNPNGYTTFVPGVATADTLDRPFDWLVHMDRHLVNHAELLNVSCFMPHELTQKFNEGGVKFNHRAPWEDSSTLLYRFFEVLSTPDYAPSGGSVYGGFLTGKMNINTFNDPELLDALADLDLSATTAIWTNFLSSRSPNGRPGPSDELASGEVAAAWSAFYPNVPFKPYSVGTYAPGASSQYPGTGGPGVGGLGVSTTLFRRYPANSTTGLFDNTGNPNAHPYKKNELLGKIMSNVTTRSNVFAVWLTVGYFEVLDDSVRPAKLGKEIGKDENRRIRRRMFAIVDRTNLYFPEQVGTFGGAAAGPAQVVVAPTALQDNINNVGFSQGLVDLKFNVRIGLQLIVDKGKANQETIIVGNVTSEYPPVFTTTFAQPHPPYAGGPTLHVSVNPAQNPTPISTAPGPRQLNVPGYFGNPGPQPAFDHRANAWIVPYASIIQ